MAAPSITRFLGLGGDFYCANPSVVDRRRWNEKKKKKKILEITINVSRTHPELRLREWVHDIVTSYLSIYMVIM